MNEYTIYCTKMQAMKAFELGADLTPCRDAKKNFIITSSRFNSRWDEKYLIPTVEQMLGWLEEQEGIDHIVIDRDQVTKHRWEFYIFEDEKGENSDLYGSCYSSRKEATLAAIDTALEYLSNQKTK